MHFLVTIIFRVKLLFFITLLFALEGPLKAQSVSGDIYELLGIKKTPIGVEIDSVFENNNCFEVISKNEPLIFPFTAHLQLKWKCISSRKASFQAIYLNLDSLKKINSIIAVGQAHKLTSLVQFLDGKVYKKNRNIVITQGGRKVECMHWKTELINVLLLIRTDRDLLVIYKEGMANDFFKYPELDSMEHNE